MDIPPDGNGNYAPKDDSKLGPGVVVLGSFRILRALAAGSAAVAFLAEQMGTDRLAVIKCPHPHLLEGEDGELLRARFAAELRALTRVNHPHVATVYMAGEHGRVPVLAMEYVPGQPLSSALQALAPLPVEWVGRLGLQIASALENIHEAGIVHRDVTPGNIVVNSERAGSERHVLLDFGVAKIRGLGSRTLGPLGTPRYMPREQVHGQATPQSDIFALGAVLWWALTGREYLSELEEVPQILLHQALQAAPLDPRSLKPELPDALAAFVSQMVHPEAGSRPTASTVLQIWPQLINGWRDDGGRDQSDHSGQVTTRPFHRIPTDDTGHPRESASAQTIKTYAWSENASYGAGFDSYAQDTHPDEESPDVENLALTSSATSRSDDRFPGLADAPALRNAIEQFVGIVPECIQDLHEAIVRRETQAVFHICRRVGDHARLVNAKHLSRLTRILRQLAADGRWSQAASFIDAVEGEFNEVFRALLRQYGSH